MRLVKHNAIINFGAFSKNEKEDLIIQELSKAFMLYPRAVADVLDNCNIEYQSIKPKDLAMAVEQNAGNLKMINRIVRIAFLVNQCGDVTMSDHDRQISYRNLMRSGNAFVAEHKDHMKDATLIAKDMMEEKYFSKNLGRSVSYYLNMDGENENADNEAIDDQKLAKGLSNNTKKWNPWLAAGLLVAFVGGIYLYKKMSK
jgi:hypothetical protein